MNTKKISSKAYSLVKSAAAAAVLPVFLIYIMIDKPDYKILNGASHIVLPVAKFIGDGVSWPIRAIGNAGTGIRSLSNLRSENAQLRVQLSDALLNKNYADIAIAENQKLSRELDIVRATPQKSIVANIIGNNKTLSNNTFSLDKGAANEIEPGMIVVSFEGQLLGVIFDVADGISRARELTDAKSNIPVRIAGSDVYGFLQGNGSDRPSIGFFSDPEFQNTKNLRLITSGIRGILPDGIIVGETLDDLNVDITKVSKSSSVMILKFDSKDKYK